MCNLLENQDKDGLLKLTLDYPDSKNKYIPFVNVEVKVDDDGSLFMNHRIALAIRAL